jgi:hypothetical protein
MEENGIDWMIAIRFIFFAKEINLSRACWKSQKTKEMWVREVWTEKA